MNKFFTYPQNNSGGSFIENDRVGQFVIIEAIDNKEADEIAEGIGIYFDGCSTGDDCECCGDRWSRSYDKGENEPLIYGKSIYEYMPFFSGTCFIYYKGGNVVHHKFNT